jgi:regulator of replication initiation timing
MNGVLKQIALLVPPVRRYVEKHRALVLELEVLRERVRAREAAEKDLEALIVEVSALRAELEKLAATTSDTRRAAKV